MKFSKIEFTVGLFMVVGILAGVVLALQVAGLALDSRGSSYTLLAKFDNIGGLKVRSPVKIGGVVVGRVASIHIDAKSFTPVVELQIQSQYDDLPSTSSASILTAGLLGEQYIGITPGFMDEEMGTELLKQGDYIEDTKPAIVLEDLIGKFLYSQSKQ